MNKIISKSETIKNTLRQTKSRRSLLDCKTYELKLDISHLSNKKLKDLNLLFVESKWLYNHILSQENIIEVNTKINIVNALDKDRKPVTHELNIIGSQIKQSIHSRMLDSIRALAKLKQHGFKIGKLKFKSRINSIPLKQFGVTYNFHKSKPNYIKLQNIKGYFKVSGIKQIPKNSEFANATLVNRNNNFYLMLTCFIPKQIISFPEKEIGIDFGIENNLVLSNGKIYNVDIPEQTRTKKLRKRLSRKQGSKKKSKKSKSYLQNLSLVNKSIAKTNNQKKDAKNKIVSEIVNTYETVCVQDESIKEWKDDKFGKQVHNSVLGGIMKGLQLKSHTLKIVDKYIPTTQVCPSCFRLNKHSLKQRTYTCECGYTKDRDTHSAQNILNIGMGRMNIKKVLGEHKHSKTPIEEVTSFNVGSARVDKPFSVKSEATVL